MQLLGIQFDVPLAFLERRVCHPYLNIPTSSLEPARVYANTSLSQLVRFYASTSLSEPKRFNAKTGFSQLAQI